MSANIKIKNDIAPITPTAGYSSVYVDQADNHLKRRKDDGSIIDYDNAAEDESVQDIVGAMLTDTATVDLTYNDTLAQITANVKPNSLDDTQIIKLSPTKIEDANYSHRHYTVTTITNSTTLIRQETLSNDGVYLFEARITGLRIAGPGGSIGDSATLIRTFRIKVIGGTAVLSGLQSDFTARDVSGYNFSIGLTSNNVNMNVVGVPSTSIKWNLELTITKNI